MNCFADCLHDDCTDLVRSCPANTVDLKDFEFGLGFGSRVDNCLGDSDREVVDGHCSVGLVDYAFGCSDAREDRGQLIGATVVGQDVVVRHSRRFCFAQWGGSSMTS